MRNRCPGMKFIAGVIGFIFFVSSLGISPEAFGALSAPASEVSAAPFKTLEIPAEFGQVTDTVMGDPSAPALIHIQSAHGNYEAEQNIEKLLAHIERNSKVRLLLLEGAAGKLQPELFRIFPKHPDFNRKVTDKLMQEGFLTGPENFLINQKMSGKDSNSFTGVGIEDLEAYKKDRESFLSVVKSEKTTDTFLLKTRASIDKRYSSKLNKDLLTFVRQGTALDAGTLSYEGWLKGLGEASRKQLKLDLSDAFYQDQYPFLIRYYRLQAISSKIDRDKALKEADDFLQGLEKRKISQDILSVFQTILKTPESELLSKKLAATDGYSLLRRAFDLAFEKLPKDFSMKPWPHWTLYAQHVILMQELEGKGLHEEATRLKGKIEETLAQTAEEKAYLAEARRLYLSKRLFSLELTRSEYEELNKRMVDGGWRMATNAKPAPSTLGLPPSKEIDAVYQSAMSFYQIAVVRENKMFGNALKKMGELKEKRAVIVTGGFHADGLKQLAAAKHCSYLQITPRITEVTKRDREVYLRSMFGPVEKVTVTKEKVTVTNASQIAALLGIVGRVERVFVNGIDLAEAWRLEISAFIRKLMASDSSDLNLAFSNSIFSLSSPVPASAALRSEVRTGVPKKFFDQNQHRMVSLATFGGQSSGGSFLPVATAHAMINGVYSDGLLVSLPVLVRGGSRSFIERADLSKQIVLLDDNEKIGALTGQAGVDLLGKAPASFRLWGALEEDVQSALQNMNGFRSLVFVGEDDVLSLANLRQALPRVKNMKVKVGQSRYGELDPELVTDVFKKIIVNSGAVDLAVRIAGKSEKWGQDIDPKRTFLTVSPRMPVTLEGIVKKFREIYDPDKTNVVLVPGDAEILVDREPVPGPVEDFLKKMDAWKELLDADAVAPAGDRSEILAGMKEDLKGFVTKALVDRSYPNAVVFKMLQKAQDYFQGQDSKILKELADWADEIFQNVPVSPTDPYFIQLILPKGSPLFDEDARRAGFYRSLGVVGDPEVAHAAVEDLVSAAIRKFHYENGEMFEPGASLQIGYGIPHDREGIVRKVIARLFADANVGLMLGESKGKEHGGVVVMLSPDTIFYILEAIEKLNISGKISPADEDASIDAVTGATRAAGRLLIWTESLDEVCELLLPGVPKMPDALYGWRPSGARPPAVSVNGIVRSEARAEQPAPEGTGNVEGKPNYDEMRADLVRKMQEVLNNGAEFTDMHLDVGNWLVSIGEGKATKFQKVMPRPDGKNLGKQLGFGVPGNLKQICLEEIKRDAQGWFYLQFSHVGHDGSFGWKRVVWDPYKERYSDGPVSTAKPMTNDNGEARSEMRSKPANGEVRRAEVRGDVVPLAKLVDSELKKIELMSWVQQRMMGDTKLSWARRAEAGRRYAYLTELMKLIEDNKVPVTGEAGPFKGYLREHDKASYLQGLMRDFALSLSSDRSLNIVFLPSDDPLWRLLNSYLTEGAEGTKSFHIRFAFEDDKDLSVIFVDSTLSFPESLFVLGQQIALNMMLGGPHRGASFRNRSEMRAEQHVPRVPGTVEEWLRDKGYDLKEGAARIKDMWQKVLPAGTLPDSLRQALDHTYWLTVQRNGVSEKVAQSVIVTVEPLTQPTAADVRRLVEIEQGSWDEMVGLDIDVQRILERVLGEDGRSPNPVMVVRVNGRIEGGIHSSFSKAEDLLRDFPQTYQDTEDALQVPAAGDRENSSVIDFSVFTSRRTRSYQLFPLLVNATADLARKMGIKKVVAYSRAEPLDYLIHLNPKFVNDPKYLNEEGKLDKAKVFEEFNHFAFRKEDANPFLPVPFKTYTKFFRMDTSQMTDAAVMALRDQFPKNKPGDPELTVEEVCRYLAMDFESKSDFIKFHVTRVGDAFQTPTHQKCGAKFGGVIENSRFNPSRDLRGMECNVLMVYDLAAGAAAPDAVRSEVRSKQTSQPVPSVPGTVRSNGWKILKLSIEISLAVTAVFFIAFMLHGPVIELFLPSLQKAPGIFHAGVIAAIGFPFIYMFVYRPLARVSAALQRKREEESDIARRRLEKVIEGAHVGIWEWNVQTGETFRNERWLEMLGYAPGELESTRHGTFRELIHPDDLKRTDALLERHFAGELPFYEAECRMKHKDGRWVWILDRGRVTSRTADGKPLMMYGTHTDITDLKQAEERLEKWEKIFQHARWGIVAVSAKGVIQTMNPAFAEMCGYAEKELAGRSIVELYDPSVIEDRLEQIRLATEKGHHRFESAFRRKDGSVFPVLIDVTVVRSDSAEGSYRVANIQDITARKQVEETLSKARNDLEQSQSIARIGSFKRQIQWGEGDQVAFGKGVWSKQMFELLGFDHTASTDFESILARVPLEDNGPLRDALEDVVRQQKQMRILFRFDRGGVMRWLEATIGPASDGHGQMLLDPQGRVTELSGIIQDVTDRKQAEAQERTRQKLEGALAVLRQIIHDIRNQLVPIAAFPDLLKGGTASLDGKIRDLFMQEGEGLPSKLKPLWDPFQQLVNTACAAMSQAVVSIQARLDQLGIFAKQEHKAPEVFDLGKELRTLVQANETNSKSRVKFLFKEKDSGKPVLLDAQKGKIINLFLNLIVNSAQAIPPGGEGKVLVSVEQVRLDRAPALLMPKKTFLWAQRQPFKPGSYAKVRVTDTGAGIQDEVLPRLFEPLFTTKKDIGTGLGLPNVLGAVQEHDGFLDVDTMPGVGTTFVIYLPTTEKPLPNDQAAGELLKGDGEVVWFLEDEELPAITMREILTGLNYQPVYSPDDKEMLEKARKIKGSGGIPPALVITDMKIGDDESAGVNAYEKLSETFGPLPYIMVSGLVTGEIPKKGYKIALDHGVPAKFIKKPYEWSGIARAIRDVLDPTRTERSGKDLSAAPRELPLLPETAVKKPDEAVSKGRILIIEDDKTVLEPTFQIIELSGLFSKISTASDAEEIGKELNDKTPIGVVILDQTVPGSDQLEVARKIKARPENPVIIVSSGKDVLEPFKPFTDGELRKPFDMGKLYSVLNMAVAQFQKNSKRHPETTGLDAVPPGPAGDVPRRSEMRSKSVPEVPGTVRVRTNLKTPMRMSLLLAAGFFIVGAALEWFFDTYLDLSKDVAVLLDATSIVLGGLPFIYKFVYQPMTRYNEVVQKGRAERERGEGEHAQLIDSMKEGVARCEIVYDAQGRPVDFIYAEVNRAFETITGLSDVKGRKASELFPGIWEAHPQLLGDYARVAGEKTESAQFELNFSPLGKWFSVKAYNAGEGKFAAIFEDITKRKRTEMNLLRVTERLQLATVSAKAGVWDWDLVKGTMTWDDRMLELYGLTRENFPGGIEAWKQGLHPEDAARAIEECEAALRGERDFDTEFRVLRPDGAVVHIRAHGLVTRDKDGKPVRMIGLNTDITAEKEEGDRLRASEAKRGAVIETALDGFWSVDAQGRLSDVNEAYCRMSGYSREELLGMKISDLEAVETPEAAAAHVRRIIAKGADRFETRHRRKDGSVFDVEISVQYNEHTNGQIICFLRDITEGKRMREVQEKERERLKSVIDATGVGTWEWNIQTGETVYGGAWRGMLGYTPQELGATNAGTWERLVHSDDLENANKAYDEHAAGRTAVYSVENRMRHKDGHSVWVHDMGKIVSWTDDGKPLMMYGTHEDISERKRAEEEKTRLLRENEERLKELNCLYAISRVAGSSVGGPDEVFQEIVDLIPAGWQYPEIACARVTIGKREYKTSDFKETKWRLARDIMVNGATIGSVEVFYSEEKPVAGEGPFLNEERALIDAISERFGSIIENSNAEAEAQRLHAERDALLGALPDLLFVVTRDGKIVDYRAHDAAVLAVPPQEFLGKSVSEVLPEDAAKVIQGAIDEAAKMGRYQGAEYALDLPGGRRWFELSIMAKKGFHDDSRAQFTVLVRDITDRIHAKAELEKWWHIFQNAQWGIVVVSLEQIVMMNPSFAEMFGYSVAELAGKKAVELFAPSAQADRKKQLEIAAERGHHIFESLGIRKNGSVFPVQVGVTVVKNSDGKELYRIANVQDITEDKRREEALSKVRDELEQSRSQAQIGSFTRVVQWDGDRVVFGEGIWSDQMFEILGLEHGAETSFETFLSKVHPEDRKLLTGALEDSMRQKKEARFVFRFNHKGVMKWIEAWTSPARDERGQILLDAQGRGVKLAGAIQDVTDRKMVEDQARQLEEYRGTVAVASSVAHDINNLLSAVLGRPELMRMDIADFDREISKFLKQLKGLTAENFSTILSKANSLQDQWVHLRQAAETGLAAIVHAAEGMKAKLMDIVVFAKLDHGGPEVFDLGSVLLPLAQANRERFKSRVRISLEEKNSVNLDSVKGMIINLFENLIVNAAQAVPKKGKGDVRVLIEKIRLDDVPGSLMPSASSLGVPPQSFEPGLYAKISVSDTGTGIPDEALSKLFEPFFTTKSDGTGLGLFAVRRIVEKHGGFLDITTKTGVGTTFVVYLPATEKLLQDKEDLPESLYGHGDVIWVLEDEKEPAEMLTGLLSRYHYQPRHFRNVEEMLAAAAKIKDAESKDVKPEEPRPDLLISDMKIQRDEWAGVRAYEKLADKKVFGPLKFIMVSGRVSGEIVKKGHDIAKASGVPALYLGKPFKAKAMAKAIKDLLVPAKKPDEAASEKGTILIIDDEPSVLNLIKLQAEMTGLFSQVLTASNLDEINARLTGKDPIGIVILDQTIPGIRDISVVAQEIGKRAEKPVILLHSGKPPEGDVEDYVDGVLSKPVSLEILKSELAKAVASFQERPKRGPGMTGETAGASHVSAEAADPEDLRQVSPEPNGSADNRPGTVPPVKTTTVVDNNFLHDINNAMAMVTTAREIIKMQEAPGEVENKILMQSGQLLKLSKDIRDIPQTGKSEDEARQYLEKYIKMCDEIFRVNLEIGVLIKPFMDVRLVGKQRQNREILIAGQKRLEELLWDFLPATVLVKSVIHKANNVIMAISGNESFLATAGAMAGETGRKMSARVDQLLRSNDVIRSLVSDMDKGVNSKDETRGPLEEIIKKYKEMLETNGENGSLSKGLEEEISEILQSKEEVEDLNKALDHLRGLVAGQEMLASLLQTFLAYYSSKDSRPDVVPSAPADDVSRRSEMRATGSDIAVINKAAGDIGDAVRLMIEQIDLLSRTKGMMTEEAGERMGELSMRLQERGSAVTAIAADMEKREAARKAMALRHLGEIIARYEKIRKVNDEIGKLIPPELSVETAHLLPGLDKGQKDVSRLLFAFLFEMKQRLILLQDSVRSPDKVSPVVEPAAFWDDEDQRNVGAINDAIQKVVVVGEIFKAQTTEGTAEKALCSKTDLLLEHSGVIRANIESMEKEAAMAKRESRRLFEKAIEEFGEMLGIREKIDKLTKELGDRILEKRSEGIFSLSSKLNALQELIVRTEKLGSLIREFPVEVLMREEKDVRAGINIAMTKMTMFGEVLGTLGKMGKAEEALCARTTRMLELNHEANDLPKTGASEKEARQYLEKYIEMYKKISGINGEIKDQLAELNKKTSKAGGELWSLSAKIMEEMSKSYRTSGKLPENIAYLPSAIEGQRELADLLRKFLDLTEERYALWSGSSPDAFFPRAMGDVSRRSEMRVTEFDVARAKGLFLEKLHPTGIRGSVRPSRGADLDPLRVASWPAGDRERCVATALNILREGKFVFGTAAAGAAARQSLAEMPDKLKPLVERIHNHPFIRSKAAVPVGEFGGKAYSYLGLMLTDIAKLEQEIGEAIPGAERNKVLIMTNADYQDELESEIGRNGYYGLKPGQFVRNRGQLGFQQDLAPKFYLNAAAVSRLYSAQLAKLKEGEKDPEKFAQKKEVLNRKRKASLAKAAEVAQAIKDGHPEVVMHPTEMDPAGHAEFFHQLVSKGILLNLIDQGTRYVSFRNIDNAAATFDESWLAILGYMAEQGLDAVFEVSRRGPGMKGGAWMIGEDGNHRLVEDPSIDATWKKIVKVFSEDNWDQEVEEVEISGGKKVERIPGHILETLRKKIREGKAIEVEPTQFSFEKESLRTVEQLEDVAGVRGEEGARVAVFENIFGGLRVVRKVTSADTAAINNAVAIFTIRYIADIYREPGQSLEDFVAEMRQARDEGTLEQIAERGRERLPLLFDPKPSRDLNLLGLGKVEGNMWEISGEVSGNVKVSAVGTASIRDLDMKQLISLTPVELGDYLRETVFRFLATKQWKGPAESYEANASYYPAIMENILKKTHFDPKVLKNPAVPSASDASPRSEVRADEIPAKPQVSAVKDASSLATKIEVALKVAAETVSPLLSSSPAYAEEIAPKLFPEHFPTAVAIPEDVRVKAPLFAKFLAAMSGRSVTGQLSKLPDEKEIAGLLPLVIFAAQNPKVEIALAVTGASWNDVDLLSRQLTVLNGNKTLPVNLRIQGFADVKVFKKFYDGVWNNAGNKPMAIVTDGVETEILGIGSRNGKLLRVTANSRLLDLTVAMMGSAVAILDDRFVESHKDGFVPMEELNVQALVAELTGYIAARAKVLASA